MLTVPGDASAAAVPVIVRTSVEHYFEGASCRFRTTFEPTLEESM